MLQPSLILASSSPRRRQLLTMTGRAFSIQSASIDETPLPEEHPVAYVLRLARQKARASADGVPPGSLILAADTTVADEDGLLGKPADPAEAAAMLRRLRGRTHQVYTAVALFEPDSGNLRSEHCRTDVHMRDYSDAEMQVYIDSGDPLDKAGAYAIQHTGFHPVDRIDGCYANVVGLPVCLLESEC